MKEIVLLTIALFALSFDVRVATADPCESYSSADTDSYWYGFQPPELFAIFPKS